VVFRLAWFVSEADWADLRPRLQEAWKALPESDAHETGPLLAAWDAKTRDASRLHWALDIAERLHGRALRNVATELTRSEVPSVATRAKAVLDAWPEK
jgi:hypothetical protein